MILSLRFLVSIPCGTIKRPLSFKKPLSLDKFQFLVVQLRGTIACTKKAISDVSIPCGTIKRNAKQFIYAIKSVSIPCGTIKRI